MKIKLTKHDIQSQTELAQILPVLTHKAITCGLLKTANLLDAAVKEIGWEIISRREINKSFEENTQ